MEYGRRYVNVMHKYVCHYAEAQPRANHHIDHAPTCYNELRKMHLHDFGLFTCMDGLHHHDHDACELRRRWGSRR